MSRRGEARDSCGLQRLIACHSTSRRDQGTDVVDILAGRIIPLRLGYVPVVNRGQRDIDQSKTIASALENERKFFENHSSYASKAQYCGTPYLARKLNVVSIVEEDVVVDEDRRRMPGG